MIDLHMHTIFSDGKLDILAIKKREKEARKISVTDHNSVFMSIALSEDKGIVQDDKHKYIVGTEFTVEGYPDYLMFYPKISLGDIDELYKLEQELQKIRLNEQQAIVGAYEILRKTDKYAVEYLSWEDDFIPYRPDDRYDLEARTVELATIRYRKRTKTNTIGMFDKEDLIAARMARRQANVEGYVVESPFEFAKRTKAELVLAHPIRTAYMYSGREDSDLEMLCTHLRDLLFAALINGCKIIEWEYIGTEDIRHQLLHTHEKYLRSIVTEFIEKHNMLVVWGTDAHVEFPSSYVLWADEQENAFRNRIPSWIGR